MQSLASRPWVPQQPQDKTLIKDLLKLAKISSTIIVVMSPSIFYDSVNSPSIDVARYFFSYNWTSETFSIACIGHNRADVISRSIKLSKEISSSRVGYAVEFEATINKDTRVRFFTGSMFIKEFLVDPLLSKYSLIIVDDFDVRSMYIDTIIALLRIMREQRPDLRLIILSSTPEAADLATYFNNAKLIPNHQTSRENVALISVQEAIHPVEIFYLPSPSSDYYESICKTVLHIHNEEIREYGNIIVFLAGKSHVNELGLRLRKLLSNINLKGGMRLDVETITSIHSSETLHQLKSGSIRKVYVTCKEFENKVIFPKIRYVVDSMLDQITYFNVSDPNQSFLRVVAISKSHANLHASIASGFEGSKCYRMCTEAVFEKLDSYSIPDIQRIADISQLLLLLKSLGIHDIAHFPYLSSPSVSQMVYSLENLYSLGALDKECRITTPIGLILAELPVNPRLGKLLLASIAYKCSEEIFTLVSMLSIPFPILPSSDTRLVKANAEKDRNVKHNDELSPFDTQEGDHRLLINIYNQYSNPSRFSTNNGLRIHKSLSRKEWCNEHHIHHPYMIRATKIRKELCLTVRKFMGMISTSSANRNLELISCEENTEALLKCILSCFSFQVAKIGSNGQYEILKNGTKCNLHSESTYSKEANKPEWIVFHEIVSNDQYPNGSIRVASKVNPRWIHEVMATETTQIYE